MLFWHGFGNTRAYQDPFGGERACNARSALVDIEILIVTKNTLPFVYTSANIRCIYGHYTHAYNIANVRDIELELPPKRRKLSAISPVQVPYRYVKIIIGFSRGSCSLNCRSRFMVEKGR